MSAVPEAEAEGEAPGRSPRVSTSEPVDLPLDALDVENLEFSVRVNGLDEDQVAHMASLEDVEPVLVERSTMKVVDGRHRITAARLRGQGSIRARLVEGSTTELFRLAVVLNATHGLPMTLPDRRAAATILLRHSPERSDRSIAVDVGLAAATVARLRRSSSAQGEQLNMRRGRDGRWRAVSVEAGKAQARSLLREHPELTLREVARLSGVSLGTACNVRAAMLREGANDLTRQRGGRATEHPRSRQGDPSGQSGSPAPLPYGPAAPDAEAMRLLSRLVRDPALCRTERGREVLARLRGLVLQPEDGERFAHAVPPHQLLETITILRASARSWIRLANSLQEQSDLPFRQGPARGADVDGAGGVDID
ncbi:MAG: hypothetical protein ABIW49_06390 [Knoellia sp.]